MDLNKLLQSASAKINGLVQGFSQPKVQHNPVVQGLVNTAMRASGPIGSAISNNNSFSNAFTQVPKIDLMSYVQKQNPVVQFGAGVGESILNSPRNTAVGIQGLNKNVSDIYTKGVVQPQNIAANFGRAMDLPLNLMGGSLVKGTLKATAEQGFKQLGKQGLWAATKAAAIEGGKLGTGFGLSTGFQSGETITNPLEYFQNLAMNTATGAVSGFVLGGVGGAGGYGINKGLTKLGTQQTKLALESFHNDIKSGTVLNSQNPVFQKYSQALGINNKTENTILLATQRLSKKMDDPSAEFVLERSKVLLPPEFKDLPTPDIAKVWSHIIARKNNRAIPGEIPFYTKDLDNAIFSNFKQGGKINLGATVGKPNVTQAGGEEAKILQGALEKGSKGFTNVLEGGKPSTKFTPQEQKLLSEFQDYTMKPEVYAKYNAGAKDPEIIQDFLKTRVAQPPIDDIPQGKVRGFAQTVIDTKGVPKEIKDFAKTQTYEPLSNKSVLKNVSRIIKQGDSQAISFAKTNETVEGNATAMVMLKKLIDRNRIDEANDLIAAVSPRFTKQGQEIQILSQFSRLKPEGAIRWAQSFIDKANKANPKLKLQLKPEQTKMIINRAKVLQKLPEGSRERLVATAELVRDIQEVVPPSLGQRLATIQTMSQLLNPKTLIRNIGGNSIFGGVENVSNVVGTGVDRGVSLFTGKRSVVLPSGKVQVAGFARGLKEGTQDAIKGVDTSGGVATQFDLPTRRTFTGKYNPLTYLEKTMNVALRAPDRAAYQAAFDGSLNNQLRAAGLTKPTPQMIEVAHADGLYRTFQDNSKLAQVFTGTKKLLNKAGTPDGKFGLGDFILKYPKTPANLLSRGLDYSPVGFLKGMYQGVRPLITGQPFNQKAFVEGLSRGMTGSGIIAAGYLLANMGILSGKPSKDYDIAASQREQGSGPFRINVDALKRYFLSGTKQQAKSGDNIVSFDWAQPISLPLAMGANLLENPKGTDGFTAAIEQLDAGASTLTQQSLVQGVTRFASDTGRDGPVKALTNAVLGAPSGFIPTFSNQIVQAGDNQQRETYDPNVLVQAKNKVIARIPGLESTLPEKIGVLGQPLERYQGGSNNILNVFANPAFVSKISENPTAKEVLDIYQRSGETQQAPRVVDKKIQINGENIALTPKQYGDYQKYVGVRADNMIRQFMNDPGYSSLSDDEKATLIAGKLSDINSAAKIELFGNQPKNVSKGARYVVGGGYGQKQDVKLTGDFVDKTSGGITFTSYAEGGEPEPSSVGSKIVGGIMVGSDGSSIDLSPPTKGEGIGAFINQNWNVTKAREVWNSDAFSKEQKTQAFEKLGVDYQDVRYDALANYTNDIKTQYLESKSKDHDTLIKNILTGRVESVSGSLFAADGVIDNLKNKGLLTPEEAKAIKKIKTDKKGNSLNKATTGKGKKVKMPTLKAAQINLKKSASKKVKLNTAPKLKVQNINFNTPFSNNSTNVPLPKYRVKFNV